MRVLPLALLQLRLSTKTTIRWLKQHQSKLILLILALALVLVTLRWVFAEMALVDAQRTAERYRSWYEHEKQRPSPACPNAPITEACPTVTCPTCSMDPVACSEQRPLPNGICIEASFTSNGYEIAAAFHQPAGGFAYTKVLSDTGMRAPELGLMGLNEYDWKLLRAGSRKPCPMGLRPCIWEQTRLLENVNGTMTSLWRTTDTTQTAFVCTSLDWRDDAR